MSDKIEKNSPELESFKLLNDSLRARIEELEVNSLIKDQDIKNLRQELDGFKKEFQPNLENNYENFDKIKEKLFEQDVKLNKLIEMLKREKSKHKKSKKKTNSYRQYDQAYEPSTYYLEDDYYNCEDVYEKDQYNEDYNFYNEEIYEPSIYSERYYEEDYDYNYYDDEEVSEPSNFRERCYYRDDYDEGYEPSIEDDYIEEEFETSCEEDIHPVFSFVMDFIKRFLK
ncbi:1801_t:CDS:1 [Funneliformis geosporum]|nr:1801_t:CDS:1 [Funneliformis geosporum]